MVAKGRVIRFRVKCLKSGSPYFDVRIFPTQATMREWATAHNPDKQARYADTEAAVYAWRRIVRVRGKWQRKPDTGWIVFHRGHVGAGIVSHEMTHAAFYYLQMCRPQLFRVLLTSRKADECLAWVQGFLVAQFWVKFYRARGKRVLATGSYRRVRGI